MAGKPQSFTERHSAHFHRGLHTKLGLDGDEPGDDEVADDLLALFQAQGVDLTLGFRTLSAAARGDRGPARDLYAEPEAFDAWADRWLARPGSRDAEVMDRVNPMFIPRNHLVEDDRGD